MVAMNRQQLNQADVQPSGAAGMCDPVSKSLGAGNIQNQGDWQI